MTFQEKTLLDLHKQLVSEEVTSVELTEQAFEVIKITDDTLNAFVTLNKEAALEKAAAIDAEGIEEGEYLKGIPVAVKDNILTEGLLTTASSKMLHNFIPIFDATVVEKLNEAGMIIVGKTNLDEFAMGNSTATSHFGATRNPWNPEHVPGGSSGGSAATVASGQVPAALGSDTGGSIRHPAAYTNLVGLKPTYGLVSRFGLITANSSLDTIGPITQTVTDTALLLQGIVGHDKRDMTSIDAEVPDYLSALDKGVSGLTVGVVKELQNNDRISSDVQAAVDNTLKVLEEQGASVKEISLPHLKYAGDVYYVINRAEATSSMQRYDGIRFGYRTENYNDLEELYVNSRTEGLGDVVQKRIVTGVYTTSGEENNTHFRKAAKVRTLIKEDYLKALEEVDVIVTPAASTPAFAFDEPLTDTDIDDALTASVNLAGLPALSVPAGFSNEELPVGVQFIGNALDEVTLLQAGYAVEQATDFHTKHPELNGGN